MPSPLQTTTKVTALSYTTLPYFLKRTEGSQAWPACPSGNRNMYMKVSVERWCNYTDWENRIIRTVTCPSDTSSSTNPTRSGLILKPKLSSENLSHRTAQSEGHNRCSLYAVHTEMALGIEQRRCQEDRQLLCERDDGVSC
jgi:AraC-like DNA-binding protein